MEEGISLFSSLLNNKHFLIVFVHALEQQKDFAVRDRSGSGRGPGPAGGRTARPGLAWPDPRLGQFASHLACRAVGIHPAPGPRVPPFPGPGRPRWGPTGTGAAADGRGGGPFSGWVWAAFTRLPDAAHAGTPAAAGCTRPSRSSMTRVCSRRAAGANALRPPAGAAWPPC